MRRIDDNTVAIRLDEMNSAPLLSATDLIAVARGRQTFKVELEDVKALMQLGSNANFVGNITTATPTPINASWGFAEQGTYPNWGGLVVDEGDLNILTFANGVYSKTEFLDYSKPVGQVVNGDLRAVSGDTVFHALEDIILESEGFGGFIDLSTPPSELKNAFFIATESGTYANYGNIVVDMTEGLTFIAKATDVYSKLLIPIQIGNQVNTIADLRNKVGAENDIVTLLGYYEKGDKAPLNYIFKTGDHTDDGGSVIESGAGAWVAIFNNDVNLSDFGAKQDVVNAIYKAVAYQQSNKNKCIIIDGYYSVDENILIENTVGLNIKGLYTSNVFQVKNGCGLDFTNAPTDINNFEIKTFTELSMTSFNVFNSNPEFENNVVNLNTGHHFGIDNVNVMNLGNPNSIGLKLGDGTAQTCVFQGELGKVKIYQPNGGIALHTNRANTSLSFLSCYVSGASYLIEGTVYSSFISCACDGSNTNAYIVKGDDVSNSNSITFVSCGGEAAQLSAWKIESGSINIRIINPHSGSNNLSNANNIGELITLEKTNEGYVDSISIDSPSSAAPSGNYSIYGGVGVGDVYLSNASRLVLTKPIGGNALWLRNNLHEIGKDTKINKLSINSNSDGIIFNNSFKQGFKENIVNLSTPNTDYVIYSGNASDGYLSKDTFIKAIRLKVIGNITGADIISLKTAEGFGVNQYDIFNDIPKTDGTILNFFNNGNIPVVTQDALGFLLSSAAPFSGGSIELTVFYESLSN